jgi:hypothetical protein
MRALWILLLTLGVLLAGLAWFLADDAAPAAEASSAASASREASVDVLAPGELDSVDETSGPERSELAEGAEAKAAAEAKTVPSATRLCGRVVDHLGEPVADVRVLCAPADRGPSTPLDSKSWEKERREGASAADGTFCIDRAPVGVVRVALRSLDHAPLDLEGVLTQRSVDNDLGVLELTLGARLGGVVLDARGRAVPDAWLIRPSDADRPSLGARAGDSGVVLARTDAEGAFDLRGMPIGPWSILVHAPEHPDVAVHGSTGAPGEHRGDLVFRLPTAASIRGRVLVTPGPHAPSLERLEVRAQHIDSADEGAPRGQAAVSMRWAEVQPEGSFQLVGLAPEKSYRVIATLRSDQDSRREVALEASVNALAGDENVELRIGGVLAIRFAPRDARSGEPIEGLNARLFARDPSGKRRQLEVVARELDGGRVQMLTDRGLQPSERAYLTLSKGEYYPFESEEFAPSAAEELDLGVLELRPKPRVEFRVVSAVDAQPVSGARVWVKLDAPSGQANAEWGGGETNLRSELTGEDGIAVVRAAEGDCGQALARHDRFASSALTPVCFSATQERVELALTPGATLRVLVRDTHGAAAPSRSVQVHRDPNVPLAGAEMLRIFERTESTDSAGRAAFEGLTPGAYRVMLVEPRVGGPRSAEEQASAIARLELAPGEERELELTALARGALSGRITSARRPLPNATVILVPGSSPHPRVYSGRGETVRVRSDFQGRYRVENLGLGLWTVSVTHGDFVTPTRIALDHDGVDRELDVDLPRNAVVGRVVDVRGDAVSDAKVIVGRWNNVSNPRNRRERPFAPFLNGAPAAVTGADGTFELQGLPAERLAIEVRHPRFQVLLTKPFALVSGAEQALGDLVLQSAGRVEVELDALPASGARPRAILRRLDGPRNDGGEREVRALNLDPRGRAVFTSLAPGKWRAEIDPRVAEQPRPRKDLELRADETERVRFESL